MKPPNKVITESNLDFIFNLDDESMIVSKNFIDKKKWNYKKNFYLAFKTKNGHIHFFTCSFVDWSKNNVFFYYVFVWRTLLDTTFIFNDSVLFELSYS